MTDLTGRIAEAVKRGATREEIYLEFLQEGHTVDAIEQGFLALRSAPVPGKDTRHRTIRVVLLLGVAFVGASIFSFVASNWQEMSRLARMGVILAGMLGFHAAGWHLGERRGFWRTGEALQLAGTVAFGAGIFLAAQMYHIRANWPDGFLLWMLGALAVSWALDSFPHRVLAWVVGAVPVIGYPALIFDSPRSGENLFLLTGSFLLAASTAAAFLAAWNARRRERPEGEGLQP